MIKNQIIILILILLYLSCKENQSNEKNCNCPIEVPFGYLESLDSNQINSALKFGASLSVNPNIKINKYINLDGELNLNYLSSLDEINKNVINKTLDIRGNNKLFDFVVLYQLTCSSYKYKVCDLRDTIGFKKDFKFYNDTMRKILGVKTKSNIFGSNGNNKKYFSIVEFNDYTNYYIKEKIENEFNSNTSQINIKFNVPSPQARYNSNQFYFNGGFIEIYVNSELCFKIRQNLNALNSGSKEELKSHISKESDEILMTNYQTIIDNLKKCIK